MHGKGKPYAIATVWTGWLPGGARPTLFSPRLPALLFLLTNLLETLGGPFAIRPPVIQARGGTVVANGVHQPPTALVVLRRSEADPRRQRIQS